MRTELLIMVITGLAISASPSLAQSRRSRAAKEFMRDKLELSQNVLEFIPTQDWANSMTEEADWRVFKNPSYHEQSKLFMRHVDSIVAAAKKKDIDTATLAYMRMTMICVDCHKVVPGRFGGFAAIELA